MNDHSGLFIDDGERFVFVNNVECDVFRRKFDGGKFG
jgi:hypothetical protein